MFNKLLQTQLQKHFDTNSLPVGINNLLKSVSTTYDNFETNAVHNSPSDILSDNVSIVYPGSKEKKEETKKINFESEFKLLLENIDSVLFSVDMQKLTVIQISSASEKVYGYTPEEFYADDELWLASIYPEDMNVYFAQINDLKQGKMVSNQHRIIKKDGNVRWIENKISPKMDLDGKLIRIDGISSDRTEDIIRQNKLNENEARFKEGEKKYRTIFENNPLPMWVLDKESLKFLDVNRAATRHYGYTREEFLLMSAYDIRPHSEKERFLMLERVENTGLNNTGVWYHLKKDNSIIAVEINVDIIELEGRQARLVLVNDVTERINTEERFKQTNERYKLVTKATNDAVWDWNLINDELHWGEGYEKLFGYKYKVGHSNIQSWKSHIHPNDLERVTNGITKVINEGETGFWEDEYRYIKADGSIAFISDRGFVIYENKVPVRMMGAMQDISNKKKTEEYLYKSEANLINILENTHTAYFLLDEKARILSWNNVAGVMADEGIIGMVEVGKLYAEVVHAGRRNTVKDILEKVISTGKPENYEVKHNPTSEMMEWLHISIHPVFDKEKNVLGLSVAITNITERKLSEQLLRESEANLRTIFDNTDISYIFLDKQFNIVSFNQCALANFKNEIGVSLKPGKNLFDSISAHRKDIICDRYELVLKGRKINYETSFSRQDGALNWYNMNVFPVHDDNSNMLGIVIAAENITDRKNTELEKEKVASELIQRNKTLEQFAYIISHNLRSPVANITGLSNIILSSPDISKNDFKKCMEGLALSIKKLDEIIIDLNHILQVRREISEKKENVRFSALVRDIKTSIKSLIEKENVTIKTNFINANELFAIKSYLNSIFYNLISNSIKYRNPDQKPVIEITSKKVNGKVFLSFKDNGLGIDLELNGTKIFGLYKKFHNHVDGKGMGLYMVKTQIEILGGKIDVKSEINKGTEFIIEFGEG